MNAKREADRPRAIASVCMLMLAMLASPHARGERVRRLALVVGVNDGGTPRSDLHYAAQDAQSVATVLTELGGVRQQDLILLRGASRQSVERALAQLQRRLGDARPRDERVELFFYYSGHSDETGLLLHGSHLGYARLRELIEGLPADVRLAVLDSCASGALTRRKGGMRGPPFMLDASTAVRGIAYVASASASEVAQESDRLRGSFFTHHLVAGLRGAADNNGDKRVTLDEAYQYAFDQTLNHTQSTRSGPQHPNYDMQLSGSGGLVLTDLRGTSALLVFAPKVQGRIYVRDRQGRLIAEVHKRASKALSLGLEPGSYSVGMGQDGRLLAGSFTVTEREPTIVTSRALREQTRPSPNATKGGLRESAPEHRISVSYLGLAGGTAQALFVEGSGLPTLPWRYDGRLERHYSQGGELRYLHRLGPIYLGATGGFRRSKHTYRDVDAIYASAWPYRSSERGEATAFYGLISAEWHLPVWSWSRSVAWRWVHPVVGGDVGGGYASQEKWASSAPADASSTGGSEGQSSLEYPDSSQWTRSLPAFYARARVGLSFTVHRYLSLDLLALGGIEVSDRLLDDRDQRADEVDDASQVIPEFGFSAGLTLTL